MLFRSKVPEPWAYGGEENIEAFEGWLGNILRWFSINRYCGPDCDEDRVVCTAMFLKDAASTWYGDNVDNGSHQNHEWSFEEVVIGLYDCFIHQGALRSRYGFVGQTKLPFGPPNGMSRP